jgi:SAM-dependent methyltransferase
MLNRIPLFTPKFSVLEVAGGRGADVNNLYLKGCSNFFALDLDNKALIKYCPKIKGIFVRNIESHPEIKTNHVKCPFINIIQGKLEVDNSSILKHIKNRFEYPKDGFELILMNFTFHYLCDSDDKINELIRMVDDVLSPSGRFILSF